MTKKRMKPLEKTITEEEIEAMSHDDDSHCGSNADFRRTFQFLQHMGVIRSPEEAAFHLYGEENFNQETEGMVKAGKKPQSAGQRRLDGLRYGRRSFTMREAGYFHEAFRLACGDEWANAIGADEFVTEPIAATIRKLNQAGLPGPWDRLNPVEALRLVALAQSDDRPTVMYEFKEYGDERLSKQRPGDPRVLRPADPIETVLKVGTAFKLVIDDLSDDQACTIVEFMAKSMVGSVVNEECQGQLMQHVRHSGSKAYVEDENQDPLVVEPTPGEFGFCIIVHPKELDGRELLGLEDVDQLISLENMRKLARTIRHAVFENEKIGLTMVDYEVPAS